MSVEAGRVVVEVPVNTVAVAVKVVSVVALVTEPSQVTSGPA